MTAERKHTDEELKQIAVDLHSGKIFSDRNCPNPDDIRLVFPVFSFMKEEELKKLKEDEIEFVYEYISEAAPRSCNGMPMFFSARMLNRADFMVMVDYYNKLKEAVANL